MRQLGVTVLVAAVLVLACGGKDRKEGDADSETTTDPVVDTADVPVDPATDPGPDPGPDTTTDPGPDPATDPPEEGDAAGEVTDAASDSTSEPSADADDEDVAMSCDTSKMRSAGIAPSPWGVGSFCDEIYACIGSGVASSVTAIFPSATCGVTFSFCMTASGACQVLNHVTVSTTQWDDLCALSLVSGVHSIYCIVYA